LEPNLAGMFLGWSSTKLLFFVPVGYSVWLPGPICQVMAIVGPGELKKDTKHYEIKIKIN
jgi:hypothetical protein